MKLIKRFDLEVEPIQRTMIPFNAEIIKFGEFNKVPCFWAIIDEGGRALERTIFIVADGKEIPQGLNKTKYMGSFEHKAEVGKHTLHVFEE